MLDKHAIFVLAVVAFQLPATTGATVDAKCYSPTGSDCTWYRVCLERKTPCERRPYDYAIAYADKYCGLYTKNYNSFSSLGKRWVNAVRKCLQVALVPLLRKTPSCQEIQTTAFRSHAPCYANPGNGAPSICDLPWTDYWQIAKIINSAFLSVPKESILGGLDVLKICASKVTYLKSLF